MKKLTILYILFFFLVPLNAQVADNFSDGNLTDSPTWEGNLDDFIINANGQLQLNAATAGMSSISVATVLEAEMEWNFFVQLDFNPSTSNSTRIYLQADNSDLLNSSGYFLEIGESGTNDALQFYRQDNGTKVLLGKASLGAVAMSPTVKVRVVRMATGAWQFLADYRGGNNVQIDLTVNDARHNQLGTYFFGFYCKYTATRLTHFLFDDVAIKKLVADTTPPSLVAINVLSADNFILVFDEAIAENTAIIKDNFFIDKAIGIPLTSTLLPPNQIDIGLNNSLTNNEDYTLTINNLADNNGNVLMNFDTTFLYTKIEIAEQYDIIINEIMEDATLDGGGTLGLPAEEYVELYNRSNKTINLEGFVFTDGSNSRATFPAYQLRPNSYLTIGKTSATDLVKFGDFLGLPNFPTLGGEETLVLKNEFGETIDVVSYTQDWYGNSTTANGGYALERINANNPCLGAANWRGATGFLGGTPSTPNSVFEITEQTHLNLINAYPLSDTQIKLSFDKSVALESLVETTNYSISNHKIINATSIENDFNTIILALSTPLIANQIETITITNTFEDCIGTPINGTQSYPIGLPVLPTRQDLIINEILFNAQTGGDDFIECFNRSEKIIDLNGLILANQALENPQIKAINIEKLVFPNDFIVLTENPSDIQNRYAVQNPTAIFNQDLPTFGDKEGQIQLYINNGLETIFLDELNYSEDWHTPLLNDKNGVSLERINPNFATQDAGNWHSAAATAGYATPTYQNSQFTTSNTSGATIFSLPNTRISPDGDGFEDVLQINYATPQAGYTATIHIYDANGRLVDKIAQNELLATEGSFKWEGVTSDGQKAPIGIYVLWIAYFSLDGRVERTKETIVVAGKL
ncbi:MAG: lamin tail domain-containing protein [Saprospiraceae bacterium]